MDDNQFKWREVLEKKFTTRVKLLEEECPTYKSFEMDDVKVSVGDYVVIRKGWKLSDDLRNCYVARVKVLYDTGAQNDSCHRAVINWCCRRADIKKNLVSSLSKFPTPPPEFVEIFADRRNKCVDDIDAETIVQTCQVTKIDVNLRNLAKAESGSINFIMRWKYFGDILEPVLRVTVPSLKSPLKSLISDEFDSDEAEEASDFKVRSPIKYCKTPSNSALTMTLVRTSKTRRRTHKKKHSRRSHSADGKLPHSETVKKCKTKVKKKLILNEKDNTPLRSRFGRKLTPNKMFFDDSRSEDDELEQVIPVQRACVTPIKIPKKLLPKDCVVRIERSPLLKNPNEILKSPIQLSTINNVETYTTPSSTSRKLNNTRRKIFNSEDDSSPVKRPKETVPERVFQSRSGRNIKLRLFDDGAKTGSPANSDSDSSYSESDESVDEDKPRRRGPRKSNIQTSQTLRKTNLTPSMPKRTKQLKPSTCGIELAREHLHTSAMPNSLPCREKEFAELFAFIEGKIATNTGGCMYISGVPGTGKTATINKVIQSLQEICEKKELPPFKFLSINGMKMTEPRQAYVQIYKELCGQKVTTAHAVQLLNKHFGTLSKSETVVLLVDELDLLWNRKQDVLYNLFNWPSKPKANLVVVAIANTMDLPERIMKNRISSRLGLARVTFQPYNFKQLQEILLSRLSQSEVFEPDSVQFIARKVAAFSGDARRALEICRRAAELVGCVTGSPTKKVGCVGMTEADTAIQEMFSSPKIEAIRNASLQERMFLRAVVCEFQRKGLEESTFNKIYEKLRALCQVEGTFIPNSSEAMTICARLGSCRLLLLDGRNDILQRVRLNISTDDVTFALNRAIAD